MRITHVLNSLLADGTGITNSSVDLAAVQAESGHDVQVLCVTSDAKMRDVLESRGVRVTDGVDTSSIWRAIRSARRAGPVLRSSEIVHAHSVRSTLLALFGAPRTFACRSVSTLHNPYQRSVLFMYLTRRIVSISAADSQFVRRRTLGVRRPRVVLNGVIGSRRLPAAASLTAAELGPRAIVFVGALYERKGVDVLLRAMTRVSAVVPDAHLYLVGNRDNPAIETMSTELGLDEVVTFAGFLPDPRTYMKAAAVFVLPSRAEGFGNVLTEARSVGAPIVASDVGGIPEAIDLGRAGLLVPPDDDEALAAALISVLTDPAVSERLREAARTGLESWRIERAAAEYEAIYSTLT